MSILDGKVYKETETIIRLKSGVSPTFVANCLRQRFPSIPFVVKDKTDSIITVTKAVNEETMEAVLNAVDILNIAYNEAWRSEE